MAGESAETVARRQREKAARLERSAELWQRGADGERATAAVLDALPRQHWTVLHDVAWPGRPIANIDHVAVGPPGVFVIDSKNWSGAVTLSSGVLRQSGRSRASSVAGVEEAARAVAGLLPPTGAAVTRGVLCLTGEGQASGTAGVVAVCSAEGLSGYLLGLPPTVHEASLPGLAEHVKSRLEPAHSRTSAPFAAGAPAVSAPAATAVLSAGDRTRPVRGSRRSASARSTGSGRRTSSGVSWSRFLKPAAGLALALVLITQPQIITGVANGFSSMFVSQLVPEVQTPPSVKPSSGANPSVKTKKERQKEGRAQREVG